MLYSKKVMSPVRCTWMLHECCATASGQHVLCLPREALRVTTHGRFSRGGLFHEQDFASFRLRGGRRSPAAARRPRGTHPMAGVRTRPTRPAERCVRVRAAAAADKKHRIPGRMEKGGAAASVPRSAAYPSAEASGGTPSSTCAASTLLQESSRSRAKAHETRGAATYELDAEGVGRLECVLRGIGTRLGGETPSRLVRALCAMRSSVRHEREERRGRWRRQRCRRPRRARSGARSFAALHRPVRVGRRAWSASSRREDTPPRDGVARAHQRLGDRRHGVHEAGTRVLDACSGSTRRRSARSPTARSA